MQLKLDLHELYNHGPQIDRSLRAVIDEAVAKRAPLVEISPGKGSGALKKRVVKFLDQKEIKALYHRGEKDSANFGRIFVHFRGSSHDAALARGHSRTPPACTVTACVPATTPQPWSHPSAGTTLRRGHQADQDHSGMTVRIVEPMTGGSWGLDLRASGTKRQPDGLVSRSPASLAVCARE